jgi:hypothetical protein
VKPIEAYGKDMIWNGGGDVRGGDIKVNRARGKKSN